ncbi:hypothetical protein TrVE_jg11156 [Triparma verrucosa]|uniref:GTP cyclohydrolase II n=1 Tax=Triparma verrucosa TaxID=1606542 RepID=A0A9W7FAU4_9STRA|nr:hypothetical protein TrVE_jg11156 [Triparma verrucosa]
MTSLPSSIIVYLLLFLPFITLARVSAFTFASSNPSSKNLNIPHAKHNTNRDTNRKGLGVLKDAERQDGDITQANEWVPHGDSLLPTPLGTFRIRAYRSQLSLPYSQTSLQNPMEPVVIYSPPPSSSSSSSKPFENEDVVDVRLHDQCFTSEVFGSLRCDCASQLMEALKRIKEKGGAIVYLMQEGRGIGLANKIKAYALQDIGYDTVDANLHLGLPAEAREYTCVPSILNDLGIKKLNLMTNNPFKLRQLKDLGVTVLNTRKVLGEVNEYNRDYLRAKKEKMEHLLSEDQIMPMARRGGATVSKPNASLKSGLSEEGVIAEKDGWCFGRESVEAAILSMSRGELVCVVDDMSRENEGDLILSSELATKDTIHKMVKLTSGVLCVAMEDEYMQVLELPPMLKNNQDPKGTAFAVSVDATQKHGITTGISAIDRAKTCNLLAKGSVEGNDEVTADDFVRPGHIFPLRAREGGVLTRDGHTEASVDLPRLAGLSPCGVLCEIVSEENVGEMARLPELKRMCEREGWVLTSIADIRQYRIETEK